MSSVRMEVPQPSNLGGAKSLTAAMGRSIGPVSTPSELLDQLEMAELRDQMIGIGWPVLAEGQAFAAD